MEKCAIPGGRLCLPTDQTEGNEASGSTAMTWPFTCTTSPSFAGSISGVAVAWQRSKPLRSVTASVHPEGETGGSSNRLASPALSRVSAKYRFPLCGTNESRPMPLWIVLNVVTGIPSPSTICPFTSTDSPLVPIALKATVCIPSGSRCPPSGKKSTL